MTVAFSPGWAVEIVQSWRPHFIGRHWNAHDWNPVALPINPNLTGYSVAVLATRREARALRKAVSRMFPGARVVRVRVTVAGR